MEGPNFNEQKEPVTVFFHTYACIPLYICRTHSYFESLSLQPPTEFGYATSLAFFFPTPLKKRELEPDVRQDNSNNNQPKERDFLSLSLFGWGCRIHRLYLFREVKPFPPPTGVLDMTLNQLMVRLQS